MKKEYLRAYGAVAPGARRAERDPALAGRGTGVGGGVRTQKIFENSFYVYEVFCLTNTVSIHIIESTIKL